MNVDVNLYTSAAGVIFLMDVNFQWVLISGVLISLMGADFWGADFSNGCEFPMGVIFLMDV